MVAKLIYNYINDPANKLSVEQTTELVSQFIDITTQEFEPAPDY